MFTVVTGVSGAGKSSLVSAALTDLLADRVAGQKAAMQEESKDEPVAERRCSSLPAEIAAGGDSSTGSWR